MRGDVQRTVSPGVDGEQKGFIGYLPIDADGPGSGRKE